MIEKQLLAAGITKIAGVDEAGRGPCAGPLVISAVILKDPNAPELSAVRDSKEVSESKREELFEVITNIAESISTIIVSPTARPKPIITAENIPGLAVKMTTRVMVCQGVAPSASEPEVRCFGTLKMASSVMEKILGITAIPIAIPTTKELR